MGRTACTEPQCLYKGALYLTYINTKTGIICEAGSGIQSLFAKPQGKQTEGQKLAVRQTETYAKYRAFDFQTFLSQFE
jgi:hypothetical protein